jgi:uncharacterized membrane protein
MTSQADKDKEIQEGKFFAIISYIAFFCIVTLVLKKDNKFALHHAKQGLVLFVFEVVCFIVSIIPILGWLIAFLAIIIFPIFSSWGILQSLMGNYSRLPLVADIAERIVL